MLDPEGGGVLVRTLGDTPAIALVWAPDAAEPLSPPPVHNAWIMSITPAPDGRHFYTGVNSGLLSAWHFPGRTLTEEKMQHFVSPEE